VRLAIALIATAALTALAQGPDARSIVQKSVELDQANWAAMKNYTWVATEVERNLDGSGRVKSEDESKWETLVLYGEPHRRMLERGRKPLTAGEQRKEQEKLDRATAKLERETPEQRAKRQQDQDKRRAADREFLREIPELYNLALEGDDKVDGHDAWVISATPKPGAQPKRSEAKALLKVRGKIWIDKADYQWVRLEAETTDVISWGLFLARLNPGAKLVFEQTRVNDEIWLPKREAISGSGRVGLVKRVALEQELTWSDYRKFQADSKIVPTQ
jgi:hypothetical protein